MTGKQLKNSILQWAIQGKLVPQDPNDEPASVLLEQIRAEKARLVKEKKIKKDKNESIIYRGDDNSYYEKMIATGEVKCIDEEIPFDIPKSWEWCRFSTIYWLLTDGTHSTPKYTDTGIPFLSVKDISSGKLSFKNTKFISVEEHKFLTTRCNPQKGDLLLSKVGTTGIPVIIDTDKEFSIFVSVALIKFFKEYIDSNYLINLINSPFVQEQAKINTRGVGNKNWVLSAISNTLLAIPPIQEQKRIVKLLDNVSPLVEKYKNNKERLDYLDANILDILKKSILQEAIQGKLVPQIASEGDASFLLQQIEQEKQRLFKEGKLKKKDLLSSTIFRGDDNKYYEKTGNSIKEITDEIPFEIPDSWRWTRLKNICDIYTGNSISENIKRLKYKGVKGMPYIGTKDVSFNNTIDYLNGVCIPSPLNDGFRIASRNSVLMCIEGGSAGRKISLTEKEVCFGNKLCCFTPYIPIFKFIYYYLQAPSFTEIFHSNKVGIIGGVSVNNVKQMLVAIPPIQEISRIVEKLNITINYQVL